MKRRCNAYMVQVVRPNVSPSASRDIPIVQFCLAAGVRACRRVCGAERPLPPGPFRVGCPIAKLGSERNICRSLRVTILSLLVMLVGGHGGFEVKVIIVCWSSGIMFWSSRVLSGFLNLVFGSLVMIWLCLRVPARPLRVFILRPDISC